MAQKPLVVLDFDGTLSPIVSEPADAKLGRGTLRRLMRLSGEAELAVLTGRPAGFVRRQLAGIRARVVGLHGNAGKWTWPERPQLLALARKRFGATKGIRIEAKPQGFAIHYRLVRKAMRQAAERSIRDFARMANATVLRGRKCLEFLPPGAKTKADVLGATARKNRGRLVLFVGDDESDAAAILKAGRFRNFRGALVRSAEVRAVGIAKISRQGIFRFIYNQMRNWRG